MSGRWPFVVQYIMGVAVTCLAGSYAAVTWAFVEIMRDPKISNDPIYDIIKPAFNNTTLAFIGIVIGVTTYFLGKHDGKMEAMQPPKPPAQEPAP